MCAVWAVVVAACTAVTGSQPACLLVDRAQLGAGHPAGQERLPVGGMSGGLWAVGGATGGCLRTVLPQVGVGEQLAWGEMCLA